MMDSSSANPPSPSHATTDSITGAASSSFSSAKYWPDLATVQELASDATMVPVYRQFFSDVLTPIGAVQRLANDPFSFLLESVVGGERVGRYSFVSSRPFLEFEARGQQIRVVKGGTVLEEREVADPLAELEEWIARYRSPAMPGLPRFSGGAVGYAAYDSVRYTERLPNAPTDDRGLPDLWFGFYDRLLIFDEILKTLTIVCLANVSEEPVPEAYARACRQIDACCAQLELSDRHVILDDVTRNTPPAREFRSNHTREQFEANVAKCQEYIRAGDIFQVVISQRLEVDTTATPLELYRALRVVNPSPFNFFLEIPGAALVGSSPEIMVRVDEGEVTIRPLAGTRKRGRTDAEDLALERELLNDDKERAEHVMLVDLARNDVGRVAKFGSVKLADVMRVERYSHVMHITSNVTGQLKPGLTALDALRAGLPAGTVSGAPKVRAMQIIDELEPHRRGPYGGAVGYIDFNGNMDTCIALRTLVVQGNKVYAQAGAGIVADSQPTAEYEETLNKARGLLKAIEIAEQQLAAPRIARAEQA